MHLPLSMLRRHCWIDAQGRRNHTFHAFWTPARWVARTQPEFDHWYFYSDGGRPSRRPGRR